MNLKLDQEQKQEENLTIFVHWRLAKDFAGVVNELLSELFGELVGFALGGVAMVDVVYSGMSR